MSDSIYSEDNSCKNCGKPKATQHDFDVIRQGEGDHLCWVDYGCEPIDWRARALKAEAARDALAELARSRVADLVDKTVTTLGGPQGLTSSWEWLLYEKQDLNADIALALVGRSGSEEG